MIVFKHSSWDAAFKLDAQKLSVLVVENPDTLWLYCCDLLSLSDGEQGEFSFLKDYTDLSFCKTCNVETSIPNISLNTKKLQTALAKKCAEMSIDTEFETQFRKVSLSLYDFCKQISNELGYSATISEDIDIVGLFKLYDLALKESFNSLLEKLIEYVNVNIEFLKTRVFIFVFLSKFLNSEQLKQFFEHCRYQDVSILTIEDVQLEPSNNQNIPIQTLIIDSDECEIPLNLEINT